MATKNMPGTPKARSVARPVQGPAPVRVKAKRLDKKTATWVPGKRRSL